MKTDKHLEGIGSIMHTRQNMEFFARPAFAFTSVVILATLSIVQAQSSPIVMTATENVIRTDANNKRILLTGSPTPDALGGSFLYVFGNSWSGQLLLGTTANSPFKVYTSNAVRYQISGTGTHDFSGGNININGAVDAAGYRVNVKDGWIATNNAFGFRSFSTADPGTPTAEFAAFRHNGADDARIEVDRNSSSAAYRGFRIYTSGAERYRVTSGGDHVFNGPVAMNFGFNVSGPQQRPTGVMSGGPSIPFASLRDKWNLPTTNGNPANLPFVTTNWNNGNGIGFLEGDNVASPIVWMYEYGGRNAFTVAKKGFQNNVGGDPSNIDATLTPLFQVRVDGSVGIGTVNPQSRLHVAGDAKVDGALEVASIRTKTWTVAPDYVFEKDYKLRSLEEVDAFVKKNKHLPEVPSAKEFAKKGMDLAEMNFLLLKKVEELTLHVIRQEKVLKAESATLRAELAKQAAEIRRLTGKR